MASLLWIPNAAGADEAGRGPLAGPVVAAAVVLPEGFDVRGLNDSKKLTSAQRDELAVRIVTEACYAIEAAPVEEVDEINILWASMAAMRRALARLDRPFERVYIDGNTLPPGLGWPAEAVVKGDGKLACIAAASILAKTARDRMMTEWAATYPQYGFDRHFGYPTPEHLAALAEHGPCPLHRRSFARVRDMLEQPCLTFAE